MKVEVRSAHLFSWFVQPLAQLTMAVVANTALRASSLSVVVDAKLGLRLGLAPGEQAVFSTVAGCVTVRSAACAPGDKRNVPDELERVKAVLREVLERLDDYALSGEIRGAGVLAEELRALAGDP